MTQQEEQKSNKKLKLESTASSQQSSESQVEATQSDSMLASKNHIMTTKPK